MVKGQQGRIAGQHQVGPDLGPGPGRRSRSGVVAHHPDHAAACEVGATQGLERRRVIDTPYEHLIGLAADEGPAAAVRARIARPGQQGQSPLATVQTRRDRQRFEPWQARDMNDEPAHAISVARMRAAAAASTPRACSR